MSKGCGPLAGLKVLDLSRFIAGPFCTQLLANLGADVVKVEKARVGDEARAMTPQRGGESLYVLTFNANKRSIEVDFRSEEGRDTVLRLADAADVLVENFRAGTLEQMGLAPEILLERNPRLIVSRISGFGQAGPMAERACFDAIAQAESGLMSITGDPEGLPTPAGTYVVDYSAGMQAAVATLAAVTERHHSGLGQVVDVALLDSAFALLLSGPLEHAMLGTEMSRIGNSDRYGSPGGTFATVDGYVHFVAGNAAHFGRLTTAMARPDLATDPRFDSVENRMANRGDIDPIVQAWTSALTTDQLLDTLEDAGVPAGRVSTVGEATRHPQLLYRGQLVEVEHSSLGAIPVPGVVPKLSRTPGPFTALRRCSASTRTRCSTTGSPPQPGRGCRGTAGMTDHTATPQRPTKLMSLAAAAELVPDGARVNLGGFGVYNRPMAFARELVRQGRRDLTVVATTSGPEAELLIGADCVSRIETSYIGLEKWGLARRARAAIEASRIEVRDYDEVLAFDRFRASQDGWSFLPVDYLAGNSILETNEDIVPFDCPLTGRALHAVRPADPDLVVLHVPAADPYGNALMPAASMMPQGLDLTSSRSAPRLILTAEVVVEPEQMRRAPHLVQIPAYRTEAVVSAPWGAHPGPMFGYYDADDAHFEELVRAGQSATSFADYLDVHVHAHPTHGDYLESLGVKRLLPLTRRTIK